MDQVIVSDDISRSGNRRWRRQTRPMSTAVPIEGLVAKCSDEERPYLESAGLDGLLDGYGYGSGYGAGFGYGSGSSPGYGYGDGYGYECGGGNE